MPEPKPELCTESNCEQCGRAFAPKNRNGLKVRFCKPKCSRDWHNAQRLKGAAMLKAKKPAVQRPRKSPIRTLDQLSAAEGLPPGCYPAGALGRLVGRPSGTGTLSDLLAAAKRMGLTEEGPILREARLGPQSSAHSTASPTETAA
jgi:hypothetical protein